MVFWLRNFLVAQLHAAKLQSLPPSYLRSYVTNFPPVTRQSPFAIIYLLLVHFPSYVPVHLSLIASTLFSPLRVASGKFGQTVLVGCGALGIAVLLRNVLASLLHAWKGNQTFHHSSIHPLQPAGASPLQFLSSARKKSASNSAPNFAASTRPCPALSPKVPVPSLGFLSCLPATCCSARLWTQPPRPHRTAHKHYPDHGQSTGHVSKSHQRLRLAPARNRSLAPYPTTSTHCLCLPTHPRRDCSIATSLSRVTSHRYHIELFIVGP